MIAIRTRPAQRLRAEELEPRVMLAGASLFNPPVDPLASSTSSGTVLIGPAVPTGPLLSAGVALPNGAGSSGVGLPDASTVGEVLALGGDPRSEALGGILSGGFKPLGDGTPDAASGVGQMVITTGANTVGATILPTSGFSSGAGGSGGPVHGLNQPTDENDRGVPGSDSTPNVKTGWFEDGAALGGHDAGADVATNVKDASGN